MRWIRARSGGRACGGEGCIGAVQASTDSLLTSGAMCVRAVSSIHREVARAANVIVRCASIELRAVVDRAGGQLGPGRPEDLLDLEQLMAGAALSGRDSLPGHGLEQFQLDIIVCRPMCSMSREPLREECTRSEAGLHGPDLGQ